MNIIIFFIGIVVLIIGFLVYIFNNLDLLHRHLMREYYLCFRLDADKFCFVRLRNLYDTLCDLIQDYQTRITKNQKKLKKSNLAPYIKDKLNKQIKHDEIKLEELNTILDDVFKEYCRRRK